MVYDNGRCDSSDAMLCPRCEFRARLAAHIENAAEADESEWDEFQGSLIDKMFDATYALHRTRRELFTDEHDEIGNSWEAATRLIELSEIVGRLRRQLMLDIRSTDEETGSE